MKNRYLTKSRFKLGLECPAKLYYTGKKEYANQTLNDSFLEALAEGGFQVGELAKCYVPGGHDIKTLDYDEALSQTNNLLKLENVIIYEAAVCINNLFVRVDILVKSKNHLDLIEVKAKSFEPSEESPFLGKTGKISSGWKSYLYDVAFQKHVITTAYPQFTNTTYLMLADKTAICPTNGLNQKFKLLKDISSMTHVEVSEDLCEDDLSPKILCTVDIDDICEHIYSDCQDEELPFLDMVRLFSESYAADKKIATPVSTACGSCEFYASAEDISSGLKSGKAECWTENLGWSCGMIDSPTVFDIWNFRKKSNLINSGKIMINDIEEEDISPKSDNLPGLTLSQRQWMQVEKIQNNDDALWIDKQGLREEMWSWRFPLHFIDFETTMVAIPFNKGLHPYEGIAFQFSHHIVDEGGTVAHYGEYINTQPGVFPNFEFVRNLMNQLSNDNGSIFRYSNHENTFLNLIYHQLQHNKNEVDDSEELCDFIKLISHSTGDSTEFWCGDRDMVDLWDLVKKYYYDPAAGGSTSIKKILPSILNNSRCLREKYSRPIYGTESGVKSLNFKNWSWIKIKNGTVVDPYLLLPKMFQNTQNNESMLLSNDNVLKDGGGALTAYAKLQFTEMSDYERRELNQALLNYCELDTMAMVMIYEGWKDLIQ